MNDVWDRIENWLFHHAPMLAANLNPPATLREIAESEQLMGKVFPDEVRLSYLRHNGEVRDSGGLFAGWEWLSLKELCHDWLALKELLDMGQFEGWETHSNPFWVKDEWWNPSWIPITGSATGDNYCFDLDPAGFGKSGQIIVWYHATPERPLLAGSFGAFLSHFATRLEAGEYQYSPRYGHLLHRDE